MKIAVLLFGKKTGIVPFFISFFNSLGAKGKLFTAFCTLYEVKCFGGILLNGRQKICVLHISFYPLKCVLLAVSSVGCRSVTLLSREFDNLLKEESFSVLSLISSLTSLCMSLIL